MRILWFFLAFVWFDTTSFGGSKGTPWLRLPREPTGMILAPGQRYLAFKSKRGGHEIISVLSLSDRKIWDVTSDPVRISWMWAPDGYRLFYRTLKRKGSEVHSALKAWDSALHKNIELENFPHRTGALTLDPSTWKLYLAYEHGVHSRQLRIRGLTPIGAEEKLGSYLVTPRGILWLSSKKLKYLKESKKSTRVIQSFDITSDGKAIVWATEAEEVFFSQDGEQPKLLGWGVDPKWSADGLWILYAGSRRVGKRTQQYDLRIIQRNGHGRWLTKTPDIRERFPQWEGLSSVVYAMESSADIYRLSLSPLMAKRL